MQENYRRAFPQHAVNNFCTIAPDFPQTRGMHAATVPDLFTAGRCPVHKNR